MVSLCHHPSSLTLQACKLVLQLSPPPGFPSSEEGGETKGFNLLSLSLLHLMTAGAGYGQSNHKLPERIVAACAAHKCFSLCAGLLGSLPPSHPMLLAAVDGAALSCKVGAIRVVYK